MFVIPVNYRNYYQRTWVLLHPRISVW